MSSTEKVEQFCEDLKTVGMSGYSRRGYYARKVLSHEEKATNITGVSFLETGAIKIRYLVGVGIVKSLYLDNSESFCSDQVVPT